ncbi:MAG: hypothetical protein RL065_140 [Bacteroidota bacterium]|jgi:hypothetical protein
MQKNNQIIQARPKGRPKLYAENQKFSALYFRVPTELKDKLQAYVIRELKQFREGYKQVELFNEN